MFATSAGVSLVRDPQNQFLEVKLDGQARGKPKQAAHMRASKKRKKRTEKQLSWGEELGARKRCEPRKGADGALVAFFFFWEIDSSLFMVRCLFKPFLFLKWFFCSRGGLLVCLPSLFWSVWFGLGDGNLRGPIDGVIVLRLSGFPRNTHTPVFLEWVIALGFSPRLWLESRSSARGA